jgi:hypothetical protein
MSAEAAAGVPVRHPWMTRKTINCMGLWASPIKASIKAAEPMARTSISLRP